MIKYLFSLIVGVIIGYAFHSSGTDYEANAIESQHQEAVKPLQAKIDTLKPQLETAKKHFAVSKKRLIDFKASAEVVHQDSFNYEFEESDSFAFYRDLVQFYEPALTDCESVVAYQDSLLDVYAKKDTLQAKTITALANQPKKKKKGFIKTLGHGLAIVVSAIFIKNQIKNF
jgi:hypothetical protein